MGIYRRHPAYVYSCLLKKNRELCYKNKALYYRWIASERKRKEQIRNLIRMMNVLVREIELSKRPKKTRKVSFVIDQKHSK